MARRDPNEGGYDGHWRTLAKFGITKDSDIVHALVTHAALRGKQVERMTTPAITKLSKWADETMAELDQHLRACEGDAHAKELLTSLQKALQSVQVMSTGGNLRSVFGARKLSGDKSLVRRWLLKLARANMPKPKYSDNNVSDVVAAIEFDALDSAKKTADAWKQLRNTVHQRYLDYLKELDAKGSASPRSRTND